MAGFGAGSLGRSIEVGRRPSQAGGEKSGRESGETGSGERPQVAFDFHLPESPDRGMNQAGVLGAGRIR